MSGIEINHYAIAVRAQELIETKAKIEQICCGVADGSIKPADAADLILARMIRDTPATENFA
jgi:hypothetical protein